MELNIPFSFGQNNSAPSLVSREFFATSLENVKQADRQLKVLDKRVLSHTVNDPIYNFAFTFDPQGRFSDIFGFGQTKVVRLGNAGAVTLMETVTTSTDPWAVVQWNNKVYYTRLGANLKYVAGGASVAVPIVSNEQVLNTSARYAVAAHDHLFLANLVQNGEALSTTLKWSDLYNPEFWNISETSEADKFSLSVDDLEITGMCMHRNQVIIFTPSSIWTARYVGIDSGIYAFDPLYSGQGCAYHYSAVRVQELVFFISDNGVYKLDSFQLVNVGEAIWDFIRPLLVGKSTVQGMVDERSKLVYWNIGTITVVYNYDKDTWATCNFNYATALKTVPGTLYSSDNIDDVDLFIDTVDIIIDAGVNSAVITQSAYLAFGSQVYAFGSGSVISHTATVVLPATYVDSVWIEKEISEVKLLIKKVGAPVINLLIGGQDASSGTTLAAGPFPMDTSTNFVNEAVFKVRNISVGKLVTLTFIATNTATDYVESWSGASVRFVDTDADK